MATDVPRADRVAEVAALRGQGLTHQQIADRLGISRSYVCDLLYDPSGEKGVARKASYRGVCERCGGWTDGGNGRAKAPRFCAACTDALREPAHGTESRYSAAKWRCRCDLCREAHRIAHAKLHGRTPPSHGLSGYQNYGCRCTVCYEAKSDDNFLRGDTRVRRARAGKRRVNPPPTL